MRCEVDELVATERKFGVATVDGEDPVGELGILVIGMQEEDWLGDGA